MMSGLFNEALRKIRIGMGVKLFLAFWLVIISSGVISHIITLQFKRTPSQEIANPQQLNLLNQFSNALAEKGKGKRNQSIKALRNQFLRKHNQHLFIKDIETNKVYLPRKRSWLRVRAYLKNNALPNPVTIDFYYTHVTGAKSITLQGKQYQLFVASPIDRQKITTIIDQMPIALRIIIMLVISFLLCWLLAKIFSKPLIAIQKASEAIGKGNLSTRLSSFEHRTDEFGEVAKSFNKMASQLENNVSAHQRLLGDVSHELRSPLARLELAIALAEKNINNPTEQQRHLNRCEVEVDRLDSMIGDVLTLSRLEHSTKNINLEAVQLTKLLTRIIEDGQYIANENAIQINFISPEQCLIKADEKLLASALSNVINNAVKYSPKNGDINVAVTTQDKHFIIKVTDQGSGVPDELLSKLFMPFFRVADSRERSSGGTGLGLAIVKQAIEQHQGTICASNIKPHGLQVTISLPQSYY